MAQKETLRQLEEYCEANDMYLTQSSFRAGEYALVVHDRKPGGNSVIEGGVPCHRLSGYHSPVELFIWLDGYHAGLQRKSTRISNGNKN